jgi:hypothetical protein
MATSNTTDFNLSIDEIVEEAFERCGMQMTSGYQLSSATRSLNLLFLDWANRGLNLWTIEQATSALVKGIKRSYLALILSTFYPLSLDKRLTESSRM